MEEKEKMKMVIGFSGMNLGTENLIHLN